MRLQDVLSTPGGLDLQYQPVFELQAEGTLRLDFVECLARGPEGSALATARELFAAARGEGLSAWLDRVIVRTALAELSPFPATLRLAFNLDVRTLESEVDFAEYLLSELAEHGVFAHQVLVEIVEQSSIEMPSRVAQTIRRLRRSGVLIAVDDVGEGFSNHRMLLALRPELLKLDRFIVDGIATDRHRRAIASSLLHLAEGFNGRLVAEGVETLDQLVTLRELGIELFQGYLLARPTRAEEMLHRARTAETGALMTAIEGTRRVRSPEAASDSRTTDLRSVDPRG